MAAGARGPEVEFSVGLGVTMVGLEVIVTVMKVVGIESEDVGPFVGGKVEPVRHGEGKRVKVNRTLVAVGGGLDSS